MQSEGSSYKVTVFFYSEKPTGLHPLKRGIRNERVKSPLCKLYVRTLHVSLHHPGVSTLLVILAENHHIPGLKN